MSSDLFDLSGQVAVVTGGGANGGLGHAMVLGLARHGADVLVPDLDEAGALQTAEEVRALGCRGAGLGCDVSRADEVERLFAEVDRVFGRIDILVNNVYTFPSRVRPHELRLEDWEKTLAVNLGSYFLCSQQAIRRMLAQGHGGSIVNISSIAGSSALGRGNFPYSASKGGVNQLTRELAVEYAGAGIRVNAIQPAQTLSPSFRRNLLENPQFGATLRQRFMAGIPLNRFLEPEEFAGPVVFLCSRAAAAVTGVMLPVDGGNLALNANGSHIWPTE